VAAAALIGPPGGRDDPPPGRRSAISRPPASRPTRLARRGKLGARGALDESVVSAPPGGQPGYRTITTGGIAARRDRRGTAIRSPCRNRGRLGVIYDAAGWI
jgi:hypothetical protein